MMLATQWPGCKAPSIGGRHTKDAPRGRLAARRAPLVAGTLARLLARGGLYARFWNRQSGGFIDVNVTPAMDAAE